MEKKKDDKEQLNVRISSEAREKFDSITNEFANQAMALETIINAYSLDQAKKKLPSNAGAIEDMQAHLQAIARAFIVQFDYISNSDNRIRTEYSTKIEQLEAENGALVRQISNLTEALQSEKQRADSAEHALADSKAVMQTAADLHEAHEILKAENKKLKADLERLERLQSQFAEERAERARLESELKESEASSAMLFMALHNHKDSGAESKEELLSKTNAEIKEQMTKKMEEIENGKKQNT